MPGRSQIKDADNAVTLRDEPQVTAKVLAGTSRELGHRRRQRDHPATREIAKLAAAWPLGLAACNSPNPLQKQLVGRKPHGT